MQNSSFFNSVGGDRKYKAENFATYFNSFIGNGIFPNPSTNLQVIADGTSMNVRIRAGKGWINGYFYENTDDYTFKIDVADGVLSRIDRVVLRLDFISREIKAYVKKGERDGVNAKPPALTRNSDMYELGIADISVGKGIIKLTQADITDLRFNTSLCGIVKGVVDQIDTTNLFAQYQNEFDIWFKNVQTQLGEDVAGSLQNQITQNKIATDKKITDNKAEVVKMVVDLEGSKGIANGIASLDNNTLVPYSQLPKHSAIFNVAGTYNWTVPNGIKAVTITAIGGGGGGGEAHNSTNYKGDNGKNGGITSFGQFISLNGGAGGKGSNNYAVGEGGINPKPTDELPLQIINGNNGKGGLDSGTLAGGAGGKGTMYPDAGSGGKGGDGEDHYARGAGGGASGMYISNFVITGLTQTFVSVSVGGGGKGGEGKRPGDAGKDGFLKIEW